MNKISLLVIVFGLLFIAAKSNPADSIIIKKKYFTKQLDKAITLDGIPQKKHGIRLNGAVILTNHNQMKGNNHRSKRSLKFSTIKNFYMLPTNAWI